MRTINRAAIALVFVISFLISSVNIGISGLAGAETTTLNDRIKAYEKTYNVSATKSGLQNLQQKYASHCVVAQAKLRVLQTKVASIQTNRKAAYDNISKQLNTLTKKLDDQAFETTQLKKIHTGLQTKLDQYYTKMANYKQAVDDAVVVDCKANTPAFYASLLAARDNHDDLSVITPDIREYITNTVGPYLDQIAGQLNSGQTTGGSQ